MVIQAYHHSQQSFFRNPFGAVPCGRKVSLKLEIRSAVEIEQEACRLRLWERETEKLINMKLEKADFEAGMWRQVFQADFVVPSEPCLVWYYFMIALPGEMLFYGNNRELLGGMGELSQNEPPSYQLTVFRDDPVPDWFKQGIMYQIFVDRFYNGNKENQVQNAKAKSMIHGDWYDTPCYFKDEAGKVIRWDFFGGNLAGVIAKLPYLKELGISIIYFNPIFEAASNHKYDTGNYRKIDPMFGDEAVFDRLIREASRLGISVILDGVFSHTGSDSIYFNKYGNYPGIGASQSKDSPYYSWYRFRNYPDDYECWWGVEALPNVNEMEPSYREYIISGRDSAVRYWMRKGVKGWRLDVADELPDQFIKELRQAVAEENQQAVLIGEVWEDASHKMSYGEQREYLWGEELHSVTNYPLREILIGYLLGKMDAVTVHRRVMSLYENYPRESFCSLMNLIGSHDRERVLTVLGEAPTGSELTERERESYRLGEEQKKLAGRRLKLLALLQLTFPGVPCIYYGDEAGVEGYADPYNRGTYPWGRENMEIFGMVSTADQNKA